jgi:hypothetical protein
MIVLSLDVVCCCRCLDAKVFIVPGRGQYDDMAPKNKLKKLFDP